MGRLDGRTALITGASRGFGRATALLFAREGADLVLSYRSGEAEAKVVAQEVAACGRRAVLVQGDLAKTEDVERVAQGALDAFGRIDVLVNNAGVMEVKAFTDQDPAMWRWMIDINTYGTLGLTHALLPSMVRKGGGRVICFASQLGHVGGEKFAVYSGTKAFILAFTKSLAREVGPHGITVNAICPGSIVTDMNKHIFPPERQKQRAAELPLRRMGDPSDVAEAVLFLAADSGRFVTGQCVDVNGGATMA